MINSFVQSEYRSNQIETDRIYDQIENNTNLSPAMKRSRQICCIAEFNLYRESDFRIPTSLKTQLKETPELLGYILIETRKKYEEVMFSKYDYSGIKADKRLLMHLANYLTPIDDDFTKALNEYNSYQNGLEKNKILITLSLFAIVEGLLFSTINFLQLLLPAAVIGFSQIPTLLLPVLVTVAAFYLLKMTLDWDAQYQRDSNDAVSMVFDKYCGTYFPKSVKNEQDSNADTLSTSEKKTSEQKEATRSETSVANNSLFANKIAEASEKEDPSEEQAKPANPSSGL